MRSLCHANTVSLVTILLIFFPSCESKNLFLYYFLKFRTVVIYFQTLFFPLSFLALICCVYWWNKSFLFMLNSDLNLSWYAMNSNKMRQNHDYWLFNRKLKGRDYEQKRWYLATEVQWAYWFDRYWLLKLNDFMEIYNNYLPKLRLAKWQKDMW